MYNLAINVSNLHVLIIVMVWAFLLRLFQSFYRGILLLSFGIFMVFSTEMWHIGGAGTLCALIMSFTASLKWKDEKVNYSYSMLFGCILLSFLSIH